MPLSTGLYKDIHGLQATNGTNATVAVSGYSPANSPAGAAAPASSPAPVSTARQAAPALINVGNISSSQAPDAHRGRSLMQFGSTTDTASTWYWSAVWNNPATSWVRSTVLTPSMRICMAGCRHFHQFISEITAIASQSLYSMTSNIVQHADLLLQHCWKHAQSLMSQMSGFPTQLTSFSEGLPMHRRQHCMQHLLWLVKQLSGLWTQLQSSTQEITDQWRQHCMHHVSWVSEQALGVLNQIRGSAKTAANNWRQHCMQHMSWLLNQITELLAQLARTIEEASITWRKHCMQHVTWMLQQASSLSPQLRTFGPVDAVRNQGQVLNSWVQFRGQPWWPFLHWQTASGRQRAERVLAEGPGVDLVVTVTVPAGQNSSEATSSIEGPAFAPSLQQQLQNQGVYGAVPAFGL